MSNIRFISSFSLSIRKRVLHSHFFVCFDSFTVDSTNGTIKATKVLDYEKTTEFVFFVLANDGGRFYEENKNYVTKIHVFLRDMNDNDPAFLNTPYTVDVMENQTDIVFVYQVCKFRYLYILFGKPLMAK